MHKIDLRSAVFVCTPVYGDVFEIRDINAIGAPLGHDLFRVCDDMCECVMVDGFDLRLASFEGITATGKAVVSSSVNSVSFSENEGIFYIDNIPCQKACIVF